MLWSTGDGWETPPARVCLQNGRAAECALLVLSLSTFQPIFRGVGALSVIALKPTQPLVLFSCQQSQLTQDPDSRMFLFHFRQILFYFYFFCEGKTPSPLLKCAHKLHNDSKSKRLSTAVYSIIALQRITKAYFQALTAQPSLQHTQEAHFAMLINQTAVLSS